MVKGFKYHHSHFTYYQYFRNGTWEPGFLSEDLNINISSLSSSIQYGQQIFEGLKAYRRKDGGVQLFRPDANARRFSDSAKRLMMPAVSESVFIDAVKQVVEANLDLVPDYETKGSLYIRPFMIGVGHNLGVKPSEDYLFGIAVSPVGAYYENGFQPISVVTSPYDRVAPNGLGAYKAGANYAGGLYPKYLAKQQGYDECLYLDAQSHRYLDEASATNIVAIKGSTYITPQSPSILPSITNHSLQRIAKEILNLEVISKKVELSELSNFDEFGFCGTAAVITPVKLVVNENERYVFNEFKTLEKIYEVLTQIQYGDITPFPEWIIRIS